MLQKLVNKKKLQKLYVNLKLDSSLQIKAKILRFFKYLFSYFQFIEQKIKNFRMYPNFKNIIQTLHQFDLRR